MSRTRGSGPGTGTRRGGGRRSTVRAGLLAVVACVVLAGCTFTRGSGTLTTQTREAAAVDTIELAVAADVVVRRGDTPAVAVTAEDNIIDLVLTRIDGTRLQVTSPPGRSFTATRQVTVEVTTPQLSRVEISGSGSIVADDVDTQTFEASVSGSGAVTAAGTASAVAVDVSGSGAVNTRDLDAPDVSVDVSGSGAVQVTATRTLDVSISGSGAVSYRGDPAVESDISGSGSLGREG